MQIPFARQAYRLRSLPVSAQRCLNLYPELAGQDGKEEVVLYGTPGLASFATAGSGLVRGVHVMDGVLYVVSGTTLYSVSSAGTATSLGTVAGAWRCAMADNGTQLVITDGSIAFLDQYFIFGPSTTGYVYSVAGGLTAIADADFATAGDGSFFLSALADGATYDALDFASAESAPDDIVRVFVDHRELWLFGESSIEVWYNSGAADFPFERISGALMERGCAAKWSVAKADNSVFWLGDDLIVYRAAGYQPQRISTHAIEYAIKGYSDVSDAFAYSYADEGHTFYALTFPTGKATWVFDASTGLWHERSYYISATGTHTRHRANCYAKAYGKHIVGDYEDGSLYELDLDTYADAGDTIQRIADSPPIHSENLAVFMGKLQVDVESGAGLTSGQGEDPQAMLQWSDDGGRTWGNEHWRSMGRIGEYLRRVIWRRLGRFRTRIFRLTITDPIKIAIIGAFADMERGDG